MKKRTRTIWMAIAGVGLGASLGCASTSDRGPAPAPEKAAPPQVSIEPEKMEPGALMPVYFEYDEWTLTDDARVALRSNADLLRQHPEWGALTIEGHCDERGSDEYNFALGQRRAAAVKGYLVDLGVAPSRLETVSFGEQKPAVRGHDESAWRYNRRTELGHQERQARR